MVYSFGFELGYYFLVLKALGIYKLYFKLAFEARDFHMLMLCFSKTCINLISSTIDWVMKVRGDYSLLFL